MGEESGGEGWWGGMFLILDCCGKGSVGDGWMLSVGWDVVGGLRASSALMLGGILAFEDETKV